MPVSRPTDALEWGTTGAVIAPTGGKRLLGWIVGEKPPAQWFNWWQQLAGLWQAYLDDQRASDQLRLADIEAHAAYENQSNVFANTNVMQRQLGVDIANNPDEPLLYTIKTAHDWTTNPANNWKRIFRFQVDGGGLINVALYVGDGTKGWYCIAVNAFWRLASSPLKWRQEDNTKPSFCLIVNPAGQLEYLSAPAGFADWVDWPEANASMRTGIVYADAHNYPVGVARTTEFLLGDFSGDVFRNNTDGAVSSAAGGAVVLPFALPYSATMGNVEAIVRQTTTTPCTIRIMRRTGANWTTPTAPTIPAFIAFASGPATIGTFKITVNPAGYVTLSDTEEYQIQFVPGVLADEVTAIRMVNWLDPGPRNH